MRIIVQTSTISTGNYQPGKTRLNLSKTEQAKFNTSLNEIADKYREDHPELSKSLRQNTCSEPLPCAVYCLLKDHKEGDLRGRPIHAATDTPATRLSKFLAKSLNTLLAHVPTHLRNTEEFIEFRSTMDGSRYQGFLQRRYIDPTRLLKIANELNKSIEFTIELPKNNQLPFVDTMVTLNPEDGKFNTPLYTKPIHSQSVTPWDSYRDQPTHHIQEPNHSA
ncbi:hypothetical protein AC249_AIPGENE28513 [Exaiptasia diaphana]|nr:hypothetical protein AC249_AIPGENE28513 [Exaiptasia diaphana]